MKKILFLLCLTSLRSFAASVTLTPKLTIWECPKGARYLLIQCTPFETAATVTTIALTKVATDVYQGSWDLTTTHQQTAFASISATRYKNDRREVRLILDVSAGWNADETQNSSLFLEGKTSSFSDTFILQGERRALDEARELVVTLEASDLKINRGANQ